MTTKIVLLVISVLLFVLLLAVCRRLYLQAIEDRAAIDEFRQAWRAFIQRYDEELSKQLDEKRQKEDRTE